MFETELKMVRKYLTDHPREAARRLAELPPSDAAAILADQPAELGAQLLENISPITAAEHLSRMEAQSAGALLCRLPTSEAASLLRRLPLNARHAILDVTPEHWSKPWRGILSYEDGTAGAWMEYAPQTVSPDLSIAEALKEVRRQSGTLHLELFVVSADRVVAGSISLRDLLREPPDESIKSVMRPVAFVVRPGERIEDLRRKLSSFDSDVIPVTDVDRKLLGVLPVQRLRQAGRTSRPGGSGVGAIVALGEVCWSGMSGAIDGLVAVSGGEAKQGKG